MKYSLITCTYNAEQYVNHYFNIIENIDYDDFEVVIVDDCSKDNTFEKIENRKKNSKLNLIIHKQNVNRGPGIARNKGIELSSGEKIVFLDMDDKVESHIFHILDEFDGDCIFFNFYKWYTDKKLEEHSSLNGGLKKNDNIDDVMRRTTGAVWGKVFSRDIIINNKIEFPELYKTEDLVFVISYLIKCERIAYCNYALYYYRISDTSAMNTNIENQISNTKKAMSILKHVLVNHATTYDIIYSKEVIYDFTNIYIRLGKSKSELEDFWRDENVGICSRRNRSYYSLIQRIVFLLIRLEAYNLLILMNKFR